MYSDPDVQVQAQTLPWSIVGQPRGHSLHTMCAYLGMFPPALARALISMLSDPGDVVMDPFSGRGTTLLEARLLGRIPLASDLNPIAVALSNAKNVTVELEKIKNRIEALKRRFDPLLYVAEAQVQSDDIQLIFHPRTLAQLCYLRRRLLASGSPEDAFILGALLGIMHGAERQDGSSAYASISMPNTFSMAPNYVRRFVQTRRLNRVPRDVFGLLNEKVDRLFRDAPPQGYEGTVVAADAKCVLQNAAIRAHAGKVRLILTSPPYLNVVNYAKQNWIRNWLLEPEWNASHVDALDDNLSLKQWLDFAESVVQKLKTLLVPGGVLVMVVGDVAKPSSAHISLAREFLQRVIHDNVFAYVGCLDDRMGHAVKTTRIWKDTKGRATGVDRVVILSDTAPKFHTHRLGESFEVDVHAIADAARAMAGIVLKAG